VPGNHDIGDNPTALEPAPSDRATEPRRQNFLSVIGEDRWRFDEAGWCFIGLNSLIMNTGLGSEAEQFDWLASELGRVNGKPVALFVHKPLYLNTPGDPEDEESAIRYVPQPARQRLIEMLGAVDLRLVASGHVHQRRTVLKFATSAHRARPISTWTRC
jgi:3',5'-cyclic AMP phosphodiesterase CpdA